MRDAHGNVIGGLSVTVDITDRKRAERDLISLNQSLEQRVTERTKSIRMLHDIATMANQAQTSEQAIGHCLQRIAVYNNWCFGHALLPAPDNPDELVPAYAYYAEDPERFGRFREVTFGLRLRCGQSLPGRAFASGKLEWTTDLRGDLIERRAVVAEELGLGTAIAFPVIVGEQVVAVLEFFSDHVVHPDERLSDVMLSAGMQLGRVIERAQFEEHLLTIADEIQRGIAQDLHDDLGQELTGLGLKTETLAEILAPAGTSAGNLAVDIATAVDGHPPGPRDLSGTVAGRVGGGAVGCALGQLSAATSGSLRIRCEFECTHPDPVFDSGVAVQLYRIAQEAVSNAVRHSGAQNIRVTLNRNNGETVLSIEDDGKGLSSEAARSRGMGLRTIRYRAGLIGANLQVVPGRGRGTRVVCRVPSPTGAEFDTPETRRKSETKPMAAKVLIVDDHPAACEGLAVHIAAQSDLEVCGQAADIPEALRLITVSRPDVAVVDIQLKTGSGLDLIERIKAHDNTIRILAWSMFPDAIYAERASMPAPWGISTSTTPPGGSWKRFAVFATAGFTCARRSPNSY